MKATYAARYQDSLKYTTEYSLPWLEKQGFKILTAEEFDGSILDRKYGIDYTALCPKGNKVAVMMRNMTYSPAFQQYNFVFREADLKTNNLREYFRLSGVYQNFAKSKVYKEFGITDYIAVQTFCDRVNDVKDNTSLMVPRAYAWTSYKNIIEVIDMGHFSRYTVGKDKPSTMLSVPWKQLRVNGFDIHMTINKPQRINFSPELGFHVLP